MFGKYKHHYHQPLQLLLMTIYHKSFIEFLSLRNNDRNIIGSSTSSSYGGDLLFYDFNLDDFSDIELEPGIRSQDMIIEVTYH